MTTFWRAQQRCEACGWTGITSAHRFIVRSGATYLAVCLVVFGIYVAGVDPRSYLPWWSVLIAFAWFTFLPSLVWRWNSCPSCKARMKVKLLPLEKAAKVRVGSSPDGRG